jgi:Fe-S-cluster-containing hydrogenase component 2
MADQLNKVFIDGIYKATDAGVDVVDQNCDECVLCKLCLEAAPAGTVHVKKLYDGTELAL